MNCHSFWCFQGTNVISHLILGIFFRLLLLKKLFHPYLLVLISYSHIQFINPILWCFLLISSFLKPIACVTSNSLIFKLIDSASKKSLLIFLVYSLLFSIMVFSNFPVFIYSQNLRVIMNDGLSTLPRDCLQVWDLKFHLTAYIQFLLFSDSFLGCNRNCRCVDVTGAYSAQKTELNISLTAVGLLWTMTDFIAKGLLNEPFEEKKTGLDLVVGHLFINCHHYEYTNCYIIFLPFRCWFHIEADKRRKCGG